MNLEPDTFIPDINSFCASVEYGIAKHLCERVQRGIEYLDIENLWPEKNGDISRRTLVVSGGVASNQRIRDLLGQVI